VLTWHYRAEATAALTSSPLLLLRNWCWPSRRCRALCGGEALLESARALQARLLSGGRLAGLHAGARQLRLRAGLLLRSTRLRQRDYAGLRRILSTASRPGLRGAVRLRALTGARWACRTSRALFLALLLLTLTYARRTGLHGATLARRLTLPLRLGALTAWRARLLLAWTVVLTGLTVRPLRLLSGRRVRAQLLLLR